MTFSLLPINRLDRQQWQSLWQTDVPFLQYDFLSALESSGCTSVGTGWQAAHAVLTDTNQQLLAAMPLYIKSHSYGEYVFDWAWGNAYEQAGLNYYPKLLCAVPFTPSTGPRIAMRTDEQGKRLVDQVVALSRQQQLSGFHTLFPEAEQTETLADNGLFQRLGCQFHWLNDQYSDFEAFLATLSSRKRKNLLKERRKVAEQGISVQCLMGEELSDEDWREFYKLYTTTYWKRSGHEGYLTEDFFLRLGSDMRKQVAIVKATHNHQWLAGALYLFDRDTLYGRYWGCHQEFDALHYECCYYQGIELAIRLQVKRFDAGAQGEHKIQRGFVPVLTQSFHGLSHPQFHQLIAAHVHQENHHIRLYCDEARQLLPFKEGHSLPPPDLLLLENTPAKADA